MDTKRIVITGGPGSGKTSLIQNLEDAGHACLHEISREVILEAQREGIEQLFLTDPVLFSKKLLEGRLLQFHQAKEHDSDHLFYDRGLPDVTAYMDFKNTDYPSYFVETCEAHRYDQIFVLPPWESIYTQDNERYESFEQAVEIYECLQAGYEKYGYSITNVPIGTLQERATFILNQL
ncbi:ATP-binding protein [Flavobacteriaceae bacterium TK19130]|nr:ATP-binding protein [Thermobacterium salinum]